MQLNTLYALPSGPEVAPREGFYCGEMCCLEYQGAPACASCKGYLEAADAETAKRLSSEALAEGQSEELRQRLNFVDWSLLMFNLAGFAYLALVYGAELVKWARAGGVQ